MQVVNAIEMLLQFAVVVVAECFFVDKFLKTRHDFFSKCIDVGDPLPEN